MNKKLEILTLFIAFFIILFSNIIFSNPGPSDTWKTCSQVFTDCDNATINDALDSCNGTQSTSGDIARVKEVYINPSSFFYGDSINVTCTFRRSGSGNDTMEIWYNDKNSWYLISNWNANTTNSGINYSTSFNVNSTEGTHIVRCMINYCSGIPNPTCPITSHCVNSSDGGTNWDNDDINFTVTNHLTCSFWNITNYTTGEPIASGGTYTRTHNLTVSALWNKNISEAVIEHNGTGTWYNYTITPSGSWTNYTLDLSNSTQFNAKTIAVKAIYVNDTFSVSNNTSALLYFNLDPGNPPNVTSFDFTYHDTYHGSLVNSNLWDHNMRVIVDASDDVGLILVKANITYPNKNISFNVTMKLEEIFGPKWTFDFNNTFPINDTGNYTIRITAIDIGGQEDSDNVYGTIIGWTNYSLGLNDGKNLYMRGENVSIRVIGLHEDPIPNADWIVNVSKINETYNFTNQSTFFNYTILSDDPEGNYSILANASRSNNTGSSIFEFNVSKNFTVLISVIPAVPSKGSLLSLSADIYNARGNLHLPNVNANITCLNSSGIETIYPLIFSSGHASFSNCFAADYFSYSFNISINASDPYNNTGENYTTLTTAAKETVFSPGGGGGSPPSTTSPAKNCTDGTLYGKCSTTRPLYCSNGTLISKCSACKCESGYSCQSNEVCTLTKAEDFNFTIELTKVEIEQGKDFDFKGYLANTGNSVLNLTTFLNISNNCCNVSLPSNFVLNEKEEKEFPISIHVPLFTNVSDYWIKIGIGTKYVNKEKLIDVKITKSSYYADLSELNSLLTEIEKEVQDYKKTGIDTRNADNLIERSKSILNNVNSSISKDQLNVLAGSITDLKNNINYVSTSLTILRGQKFLSQNSWLIMLLIISTILTTYFVPEVFMPLNDVEKEIKKLRNEEKISVSSRVETEKQYFTRRIDENTFTKIMITKQDSILKLRATISEREKERINILKKMHPVEMLKWFGRGIKNLPKNTKNIFVRAYKKVTGISLFKKQTQK